MRERNQSSVYLCSAEPALWPMGVVHPRGTVSSALSAEPPNAHLRQIHSPSHFASWSTRGYQDSAVVSFPQLRLSFLWFETLLRLPFWDVVLLLQISFLPKRVINCGKALSATLPATSFHLHYDFSDSKATAVIGTRVPQLRSHQSEIGRVATGIFERTSSDANF
jgi:hypothetical protein